MNRIPDAQMYLECIGGKVFDLPPWAIDRLSTHLLARPSRRWGIQRAQSRVDTSAAKRALRGES